MDKLVKSEKILLIYKTKFKLEPYTEIGYGNRQTVEI